MSNELSSRPGHEILSLYRYEGCGLDNVILRNIEVAGDGKDRRVFLRGVSTLHRIIAFCFAYKPARLSGSEIRFIRSVLGSTAKDFAESVSIRPESLSRIENGHESAGARVDKLVRFRAVFDLTEDPNFKELFDLDEFKSIVDRDIPENLDDLDLFLEHRGPHAAMDAPAVEFEFR